MPEEFSILRGAQDSNAAPIVENAALPRMGEGRVIASTGRPEVFMDKSPGPARRMDPLPTVADGRIPLTSLPEGRPIPASGIPEERLSGYADQQRPVSVIQQPEGYVRLQVHVDNGKLTVTDAKEVPGPLVLPDTVAAGLAYEARINDKRVGLGSIPDANIIRSFPNPGVPGQEGHKFFEVPSFDFYVRVPRADLTPETLPKLDIALYKVHEQPHQPVGPDRLVAHPALGVTEIGRVEGIHVEQLAHPVRSALARAIGVPM